MAATGFQQHEQRNTRNFTARRAQVSQVPHEEVSEEAQRAGLVASDRLQQGPRVRRMPPVWTPLWHTRVTAVSTTLKFAPAGCADVVPVDRRSVYELRYFNIAENEGEDEE